MRVQHLFQPQCFEALTFHVRRHDHNIEASLECQLGALADFKHNFLIIQSQAVGRAHGFPSWLDREKHIGSVGISLF